MDINILIQFVINKYVVILSDSGVTYDIKGYIKEDGKEYFIYKTELCEEGEELRKNEIEFFKKHMQIMAIESKISTFEIELK